MCGIAGCLALALEADPDQAWVAAATQRIAHRGPDDEGFYTDPDVALGYKRLSIIDLSQSGHQPMRSADGRYWMVFNGEIYNYIELGQELRAQGVTLRSTSDSEVLLESYARMGKDVVHKLRGMYAFAIWDTWTRELFCARDPFGIKPFYYRLDSAPGADGDGPSAREGEGGPSAREGEGGQGAGWAWGGQAAGQTGGGQVDRPDVAGVWSDQATAGEWGGQATAGEWDRPSAAGVWGGQAAAGEWERPGGTRGRHAAPAAGAWDGQPPEFSWSQPPEPEHPEAGLDNASRQAGPGEPGSLFTPRPHNTARGRHAAPAGAAGASPRPGRKEVPFRLLKFASERKALADPGDLRELDAGQLRRYLSFQYVPPPGTLTPPIQVLPPGHALIARPGGALDVYRYWRPDLHPAHTPAADSAQVILAAMRDSVAVHLRSDAPLGAFLSGGIDSAAICALAAEHRPDLLTFTVGFEREGYSEIDRAQETAAAIGVKSVPYLISQEEFFRHLPQIIWHLDDPMADAAAVPLWFVAREASKQVKVVLSGEGSDELFGGYAIYHQPSLVRAGERLPDWGRAPLKAAAALIPTGVKGKGLLERTSTPLRRRYIGNAHVFSDDQIDAITVRRAPGTNGGSGMSGGAGNQLSGGAGNGLSERPGNGATGASASPYDVTDPIYDQAEQAGLDDVSTMQLVDINTWLVGDILVKADRMTMAHSLELRVPFLDPQVMAVAARLAREEKVGAGTTKAALRAAMSAVLPTAAARRAKLGFPVPIGHWLKGDAYHFADRLLREAQTEQWIDRAAALALLGRFRKGEHGVTWRHLWVLMVFSLWHQIYCERAYDPIALGWERAQGVTR